MSDFSVSSVFSASSEQDSRADIVNSVSYKKLGNGLKLTKTFFHDHITALSHISRKILYNLQCKEVVDSEAD